MKIAYYRHDEGDWELLYVDGKLRYANHSVPEWLWIELLKELGAEVTEKEVTSEWIEENTSGYL